MPRCFSGTYKVNMDSTYHQYQARSGNRWSSEERLAKNCSDFWRLKNGGGSLNRADASADTAGKLAAHSADERLIGAGVLCRIEIDELNFRIRSKSIDPLLKVVCLDGQALTLHQLNDATALQVD